MNICLYYHKKLNGEIFYVGIGDLKRPYSKYQRNKFWHNVVNKHGFIVEIVHKDITWEEACLLEKKYIKLFGRRDLGNGSLVNLTDGGEGTRGLIVSEDQRRQISNYQKGKIRSIQTKKKMSDSKKGIKFSNSHKKKLAESFKLTKSIIQYSMDEIEINKFNSIKEAISQFKNPKSARAGISRCINHNYKSSNGFIWKYNK